MTAAKNNEITGLPMMFIFTTFDVDKETLNASRLFQGCRDCEVSWAACLTASLCY